MQAAVDADANDAIAVRRDQLAKLGDAFIVRARRPSDVEHVIELQHVAAVDRGGRVDADERPVLAEDRCDGIELATARLGAGTRDHRDLAEHDRSVFDEHRVGIAIVRRNAANLVAKRGETRLVRGVLLARESDVDRRPCDVRQLAIIDRCADAARDRNRAHSGSQYETFTRNTSCDGAVGIARRSRRKRKSPIGATSARFSFHTTYIADPGRNSHRTTALPRTLRKLKSGLPSGRVYGSKSRVRAATSEW